MKTKDKSIICPKCNPFSAIWLVAVIFQIGVLASFAQTGIYLFSGSETTITLNPGTYNITAYGAQGGGSLGGLGAEMSGEFSFSGLTTLTLLVGGVGGPSASGPGAGGGGGGSFIVEGNTPLVIAGGGGGYDVYNTSGGGLGLTGTGGGGGYGYAAGVGGSSGNGGSGADGGGGGGFFSGGVGGYNPLSDGKSFLNGGAGGNGYLGYGGSGGFGGFGGGGGSGAYGGGGGGGYSGGGSGGNSGGGGGGGSIINSSAIMVLAEVSGVASPNGSPNGEIIIMAVPEPTPLALAGLSGLSWLLFRRQRK